MTEYYQGANNATSLKAVTLTFLSIATVLVTWRVTWRIWKKLLGLSDYLLLIGMALCVCLAGFTLDPYIRWGYGYHKSDLPPDIQKAITPRICFYLSQVFFKAAAGTIKLSVAVIYMTIFKQPVLKRTRIARYCNFGLMFLIVSYYMASTLVSVFQCTPVRKVWHSDFPGTCIDIARFRVPNAFINAVTSVLLVVLPFPALLTMEHQSKELWQFFGLISLGLVHTGCAVCRIVQIYNTNPNILSDPQWYYTSPYTIAMAEIFTALLVATIITMRPCFLAFGNAVISAVSNASHLNTNGCWIRHRSQRKASTSPSGTSPRGYRQGLGKILVKRDMDLELQSKDCNINDVVEPSNVHTIGLA